VFCATVPKHILEYYYSASAKFCLRNCQKASRSPESMPSKAQATPLPTFGVFEKFETRMQNRLP